VEKTWRPGSASRVRSSRLLDIVEEQVACPPEIAGGLLRALFRKAPHIEDPLSDPGLTQREKDVLRLIGQGHSNEEIASELHLSVATIKHHVHHVLDKLNLPNRAQAMRRVRDAPWLASAPETLSSRRTTQKQ
jgi:DNA-binding NarL/FixJ family response regulator